MEFQAALRNLIDQERVPLFGVANTNGFQHAQSELHPRQLVPRSKSVLVFGVPFVGPKLMVDERTNLSNDSYWTANEPIQNKIFQLRAQIVNLLDSYGYAACNFGGFGPIFEPTFSYRLAQYEAGIGVYGRFGVCINRHFGCYYTVGVLLTDAELAPTEKSQLDGFHPCNGCRRCADVCPARAIDASKNPEVGYDRDRCIKYILGLKKRYSPEAKACAKCFSICPWGYDKVFGSSSWAFSTTDTKVLLKTHLETKKSGDSPTV